MLSPEVRARFDRCKPLYSWPRRLLGAGSVNVSLYRAWAGEESFKLLSLSKAGRSSQRVRAKFSKTANTLARFRGESAPRLVYADAETLVVNWVDGETLSGMSLSAELCMDLAATAASQIVDCVSVDTNATLAGLPRQVQRLVGAGVLDEQRAGTLLEKLRGLDIPHQELEGLCFADAALKNYVLSPDKRLHYIDVFGIYRTRLGHNLMRHLLFIPRAFRQSFVARYEADLTHGELTAHLSYHYAIYLLRIAASKSSGGRALVRRRRLERSKQAVAHLERFFVDMGGDPALGVSHILTRENYV